METLTVLASAKRGPITVTSANITLPAGGKKVLSILTDIPKTDLAGDGAVDLSVERFFGDRWEVILRKEFKFPFTKPNMSPYISAAWDSPDDKEWTVRATISISKRITLGLSAEF